MIEKGGKERDALVLLAYHDKFAKLVNLRAQKYGPSGLVFGLVNKYLDVHAYRRQHLQLYYNEILQRFGNIPGKGGKGIYTRRDDRKVFDRYALGLVTKQAGHNRIDIIVKHYLD